MRTRDAAKKAGRTEVTIRRWIQSGILKAVKDGDNDWFITEEDLAEVLRKRMPHVVPWFELIEQGKPRQNETSVSEAPKKVARVVKKVTVPNPENAEIEEKIMALTIKSSKLRGEIMDKIEEVESISREIGLLMAQKK